jgi:hypothetical protein
MFHQSLLAHLATDSWIETHRAGKVALATSGERSPADPRERDTNFQSVRLIATA